MAVQKFKMKIDCFTEATGAISSDCNAITFINKGAATVTVAGYPIAQNEFLVIPGNAGEMDTTTYKYTGNTNSLLFTFRKYYIK